MFSAIRRRLRFSPASVIAGLALVFAMTGGAYAAKKYLITSTKQISPSVLKQLQGKAGAVGAPGAQGAQGPAGPAGPGGAKGETGPAGEKGSQGEKGVTGPAGKEGKAGSTGATGVSGFTETLPSGKTETGTWAIADVFPSSLVAMTGSISFPIPLASISAHVVYLNHKATQESVGSGGCEYNSEDLKSRPVAPAGTLCVFTFLEEGGEVFFVGNTEEEEDMPSGALIWTKGQDVLLRGVWAVTAG